MKTVLFICTGNTCRSSMAESVFRDMLEKAGKEAEGIEVISAGTAAFEGQEASAYAVQMMKEMGVDLSGHKSTPLTKELVGRADIILTMTLAHKRDVLRIDPQAEGRVFAIREFVQDKHKYGGLRRERDQACDKLQESIPDMDIGDPYGKPLETYRQCAYELKEQLEKVLDIIMEK